MKKIDIKISDKINDKMMHGNLIELVDEKIVSYKDNDRIFSFSIDEEEMVDYVLMSDTYFYRNWITQFAIGNVGGRNYFDMESWSKLTDQYTKGVIVVHEETKDFLFLIPKFIEPRYGDEVKSVIENLTRLAAQSKNANPQQKTAIINKFATLFVEASKSDKAFDGVTDLIPERIYKMFKVNPKVLKDIIYIRDHFKTITPGTKEADKAVEILTKRYEGGKVSSKEKEFILSLTDGQYIFPGETKNLSKKTNTHYINDVIDPFED